MATLKPISTISYNSESFLVDKLNDWISCHLIQAYQYICHKGEDGDKDHIHLRIEPNRSLDPMFLSEKLLEYVPECEKPLGCRPWRPSKEEDWILYAVHDEQYLKIKYGGGDKGEKLPYNWQEIKVSTYYDMEIAYIRAKAYLEHTSVNMMNRLMNGDNPVNLILQGENVHTVNALNNALTNMDYSRVSRELLEKNQELALIQNAILNYGLQLHYNEFDELVLVPLES